MVAPICERVQSNWVGLAAAAGLTVAAAVAVGLLMKKGSAPIPRGDVSLMSRGATLVTEADVQALIAQLSPQELEKLAVAMEAFAKIEVLETIDRIKCSTLGGGSSWGVSEWTEWLESVRGDRFHELQGTLEAFYTHGEVTVEEMAQVLTFSRSSEIRQLLRGAHAELEAAMSALSPKAREAYELMTRLWRQQYVDAHMLSASARVASAALGGEGLAVQELYALTDPNIAPAKLRALFEGNMGEGWDVGGWAKHLAHINADAAHPLHETLEELRSSHNLGIGQLAQWLSEADPVVGSGMTK